MKYKSINDLKTFSITTLGCKVNTYESNIIQNELLSLGLVLVPFNSKADLYIINTCSVTNTADSKSRNIIRRANRINPDAIVLVCGCYSQIDNDNLKQKYGINILLGNKYKNNISQIINEYLSDQTYVNNETYVKIDNLLLEKEFENSSIESYKDKTRAFVKIQDGCNFMCSYCIIPFTRGRQRSKNFDLLINEIKQLVNNGYKEIVLTGVNTAGYESNGKNFYDLLVSINEIKHNFRVRISSVEPFQISDQIIELISNNPTRFAQHWHICLQSGSDCVLEKMNRKYTTHEFINMVNKIYSINPYAAISTDYICGFPTETHLDHCKSLKFLEQVGFYKIHVFPYSKRSFTMASKLKEIKSATKTQRVNEVIKLSDQLSYQFIKKFKNKQVEVLFEQEISKNTYRGHSSQYFEVIVKSEQNLINQMSKVLVKTIMPNLIIGELIEIIY